MILLLHKDVEATEQKVGTSVRLQKESYIQNKYLEKGTNHKFLNQTIKCINMVMASRLTKHACFIVVGIMPTVKDLLMSDGVYGKMINLKWVKIITMDLTIL